MQYPRNKKAEIYIVAILGLMAIVMFTIRQLDLGRMEKDGVYVLGYVAEASPAKNGVIYNCFYKFNNIIYKANFTALNSGLKKGDLLFF